MGLKTAAATRSEAHVAVGGERSRKPWGAIALFLGPITVYYVVFVVYPLFMTVYYSFHHIAPLGGKVITSYVGLQNFKTLLRDAIFTKHAVPNTLLWAIVGPTIEMITATTLAFIVYFRVPLHRFYRTAWFTPVLVSGVIVGVVFRWIFNVDWGLLNTGLRAVGLEKLALNWLGRTDTPIWVVIFVHYWATFGYSFVLLLAGLTAIPAELLEAAKIDGASMIQAVGHVMFPLLRPTFVTVLILSFMGKMRSFNVVWVLTQGRPMHASETVATYVQKRAFGWGGSLDLGYPAAMAVVWFGVVMIGVWSINRWLTRKAEY